MKNKFSLVLLVLLISFCSSSSNDNTDTIKLNNLNLKPLIEEDKIQLETDFLIINYWASWCLECIEEHELLISLAESQKLEGKVVMVSFQDNIENSIEFLNNYGYGNIVYAIDNESKLAIDSGVFGVPETHIIIDGEIVKKFIGPLNLSNVEEIVNNFP
ncbi:redoxin family protein [Acidimicrobiaceae bacterium]|jgi:cytochrome c biogenesis protein CcmG/thiol:disulfide interchange protein DsbE|nr:redoxin family protein [Acidimicrobiaceae bacterium]|tara:strand:+ start:615 stop:1091 length:477 start_codon:yes stop_codon:yes gene_type:complete